MEDFLLVYVHSGTVHSYQIHTALSKFQTKMHKAVRWWSSKSRMSKERTAKKKKNTLSQRCNTKAQMKKGEKINLDALKLVRLKAHFSAQFPPCTLVNNASKLTIKSSGLQMGNSITAVGQQKCVGRVFLNERPENPTPTGKNKWHAQGTSGYLKCSAMPSEKFINNLVLKQEAKHDLKEKWVHPQSTRSGQVTSHQAASSQQSSAASDSRSKPKSRAYIPDHVWLPIQGLANTASSK
jgi:hypothetical protein